PIRHRPLRQSFPEAQAAPSGAGAGWSADASGSAVPLRQTPLVPPRPSEPNAHSPLAQSLDAVHVLASQTLHAGWALRGALREGQEGPRMQWLLSQSSSAAQGLNSPTVPVLTPVAWQSGLRSGQPSAVAARMPVRMDPRLARTSARSTASTVPPL